MLPLTSDWAEATERSEPGGEFLYGEPSGSKIAGAESPDVRDLWECPLTDWVGDLPCWRDGRCQTILVSAAAACKTGHKLTLLYQRPVHRRCENIRHIWTCPGWGSSPVVLGYMARPDMTGAARG